MVYTDEEILGLGKGKGLRDLRDRGNAGDLEGRLRRYERSTD